ncbi:myocardin-related transcription factor B isoform X2 [Megalops cyprinoides]|uniref:myocardin-related transcription factor B isoform X2 n=1 Tax=Megalops cyprinoides TaxID=118141 RepID=UPI0018656361|nr:myocardin-related transcription factor B isoform X2 [Megalops cyprinoides]
MEPRGTSVAGGDRVSAGATAPSPRSESVTHELEELTLQPASWGKNHSLPSLKDRKNALQLRLQQRRTREQLVDQGIMPPLKTPAAFHEQIRSLERARTENFLKHKISSRPERSELVRMHILQETHAEASLQATQLKLKRARLADDLNEKLALRPGPMELVEKNILPVDSSLKEAIIVGEVNYPKTQDVYAFEEDSSDALSPERPASRDSQGSTASPRDPRAADTPGSVLQFCPPTPQPPADSLRPASANENLVQSRAAASQPITATTAPLKAGPTLVKQSQPKPAAEKSRGKKGKEARPRVKKLKYHQYVPPDQKQEPSEPPMDSAYARLLQQQQLFLQLQILGHQQQQQSYSYQAILPASLKPMAEVQNGSTSLTLSNSGSLSAPIVVSLPTASPTGASNALTNHKPGALPANLDEMKVAKLKQELKLRGLPVSGTKTDLIERLKPFVESAATDSQQGAAESMRSTSPVSPVTSELSNLSAEEAGSGDPQGEVLPSQPTLRASPGQPLLKDPAPGPRVSERDQRLHEKERQIEALRRQLEQEQRLVEELKMQLKVVEKRGQQNSPLKEENGVPLSCSTPLGLPTQPVVVKQEELLSNPLPAQPQMAGLPQFCNSPQQDPRAPPVVRHQPLTLLTSQPGTQILLPISTATIQLPSNSINLQTQPVLQAAISTPAPGFTQACASQLQPQKGESSPAQQLPNQSQQQLPSQGHHMTNAFPVCSSPSSGGGPELSQAQTEASQCFLNSTSDSRPHPRPALSPALHNGPTSKPPSPSQPTFILQRSTFTGHAPKCKDPPRYEEAVKQTRSIQAQVPTATSQQMDDLFDILIESGEISPFVSQGLPSPAVTASVTTLPVSTALSRPPPQVQVAPPPAPTLDPMLSRDSTPSLGALASDRQLEAFLEDTLSAEPGPQALRLIGGLHCPLLDSAMDTSELSAADPLPSHAAFDVSDGRLEGMEWLDLTAPTGPGGSLNPLGSLLPATVFSSDLLDSHNLPLHWD